MMIRQLIIFVTVVGIVLMAVPVGAEPATLAAGGSDTANAGETVTISYTVTNTGGNSSGYILDVSIPEGWGVETHTDDGGTWKAGEYDWLYQTIGSGESASPSVTLSIPESAEGRTATITAVVKSVDGVEARMNRTVTITSSDGDGNGGNGEGSEPTTTTITPAPATTTATPITTTAVTSGPVPTPGFDLPITLVGIFSAVLLALRRRT